MKYCLYILLFTAFTSCVTVQATYLQKNGREKSVITYLVDKTGNKTFSMKNTLLPSITLKGTRETDTSGDTVLNFRTLHTFTNGSRSYSEGTFTIYGKAVISKTDGRVLYKEIPEVLDIQMGEMRVNDNYYRGKEGTERIKNKYERLKETAEYLKTVSGFPIYAGSKRGSNYFFSSDPTKEEDFYSHAKRILVPEIYGIDLLRRKGLLDSRFISYNDHEYTRTEDLVYNTKYTKEVLTPALHEVRNTGTMLRDIEESSELLKALYNYNYFFDTFLTEGAFIKIQK